MLVLRQCYHEGADHDVKGDWLVPISGVLRRIEDNLNYLSLSEKKVAQWILDHPHEVLTMTVKEVAHHAQSSQAAVTRCCHTLQVDGFGQMKVLLTADLVREEHRNTSPYAEINPDSPFETQLQSFQRLVNESIHRTLNGLNLSDLSYVCDTLVRAPRILVFGMAASGVVAQDLTVKLVRLGYPAFFWADFHVAFTTASLLSKEDVAFLVSYSGSTREVLDLANLCRDRGCQVFAMTEFQPKNPLLDRVNRALHISAVEPTPRVGATTSLLASLTISDALMLWLANHHADHVVQALDATHQAVVSHRSC